MSELEGGKILVLIRPDCAPCQRKALQIQENAGAFEEYEILFVSDASLPQLRQIASSYNRAGQRNIYIAQAATKDILHLFGSAEAPSILVFSKEGRLVDTFSGRTPIQEILASL
ncbi:TlpA family protein disulfide reductase [Pontibacter ummariensis]|nr:hypothetical protein [Pontibacter ummariensis]